MDDTGSDVRNHGFHSQPIREPTVALSAGALNLAREGREALETRNYDRLRTLCMENAEWLEESRLFEAAAFRGSIAGCEALLSAGAALESDYPPLLAAAYNAPGLVKYLLSRGALVDGAATAVSSPLCSAASGPSLACARVLVEAGADLDRDSLLRPGSALNSAEDPPPNGDRAKYAAMAEYLRSVGATKPWEYRRASTFWEGTVGQLTTMLIEAGLGLVAGPPLIEHKSAATHFDVRRCRYGYRSYFQGLFTAGMTASGGACEFVLVTHSFWPTHCGAIKEPRFRAPVDFLATVAQRTLESSEPVHGDVLDRDHPLVGGVTWPGAFNQWLVVEHESIKLLAAEMADPKLPKALFLVPVLDKKPLKSGPEARARADFKANVKWEKPAMKTGKNNLTIPLCYSARWLSGLL